jgi:type II secretion system protein D
MAGTAQTTETRPAATPPSIEQLMKMQKILKAKKGEEKPTQTQAVETPAEQTEPTSQAVGLPTTLPAGDKGIQFSFNNAPYTTVLDFVERVTGLPIIGDRNIPGTLTYFSRKKMTVNEAMEELNLLLKEKGVVIVREDDRLQISKFPDVLRGFSVDYIGADSFMAADVPSNQVVRVFFKVNNLPATDITNLIAEALPVNEVKLAAWRANNIIQVVGLASRVKEIVHLSQKLDEGLSPAVTGLEFKVFKTTYIVPSALERMIKTMLPPTGIVGAGGIALGQPGGQPGRPSPAPASESAVQIAADDLTGTLAVRASQGQIQEIAEMIEKLDQPEEEGNVIARSVSVQYGNVKMIEAAINETIKQRLTTKGRGGQLALAVKGDEVTHAVILAGTRSIVEQAEQLVKDLDQPAVTTKLQVIPLKAARAEEVLRNVITPFYQSIKQRSPAAADVASNAIITWATGEELKELKELVLQLDDEAAQGKGVPNIRTYRLDEVNVNNIATNLQKMFAKQTDITFGADPAAKTLIVAAPADKFEQIEKVIDQLRTGFDEKVVTRLVKLQYANVDQVANAVKGAFALRKMPTGEPRLVVSTNVQANSILLTGDTSTVEEATSLIGQFDREIQASSEIKTYKLSYANSDDLAAMITNLYGGKDTTLKVVSEPWSNTLFISGGSGNMKEIEQLIETTDHAEPEDLTANNIAFITLKTASASDAALQIESMVGEKNGPSIEVSDVGNYLVVTGQPKQIERVRQLAEQIDTMALQIPEILAVRPVQRISADRLAQMLHVIVPQISGTEVDLIDVEMGRGMRGMEKFMADQMPATTQAAKKITIGVDKKNNTLVIRGRPRDIEEIDNTIETLTADIEDEVQFRTYTLKNANPAEVAMNLESLFNEVTQQVRPPQPARATSNDAKNQPAPKAPTPVVKRRIRAIPVDNINAVVVRAAPNDFAAVEEFIQEMDRGETEKVKVYKLTYARADAVAKNINDLFAGTPARISGPARAGQTPVAIQSKEMKVSFDMTSNSVIVSAPPSDLKDIGNLIKTLDQPEAGGVDIHLIPLTRASAETLAPNIQRLLIQAESSLAQQRKLPMSPVFISAERTTNSLIVAGNQQQYEQVKKLVEKIESMRPTGARRTFILPLKNMDPNRAKQILDQLLPPGSRGDLWRGTKPGLKNWKNELGEMIFALSVAQVSADGQTTTQPVAATQPKTTEPAIPLSLLQQIFESRVRRTTQPTTKPAENIRPEITPSPVKPVAEVQPALTAPVPTTSPAPKAPELSPLQLQNLAGQIQGDVEVTSVPEQNALIIEATEEDFQIIQQLMSLLEETRPQPKVQVFNLKNAQAQDLANNLNSLFRSWPQPRGYPPVNITPDTTTNSIIVSASPDVLEQIAVVVTQLDTVEQAQQMDFKIYQLKNAQASQLVPQLQSMLTQVLAARGVTRPPFNITADDRTNTIIVTAPEGYFDQIGKLITTLDSVPSFSTVEFALVRLKQADADQLGKVLDSLINPKSRGKAASQVLNRLEFALDTAGEKVTLDLEKPILYIPDKASQSMLLLSTSDNIEVMKKIVKMLDTVPLAEDLFVRIYPLKFADANEIRKSLQDIFNNSKTLTQLPGTAHTLGVPENTTGQALIYSVVLASDTASNTLIAAGQEPSLALVEVLVNQLDKEDLSTFYPIRLFRLENASSKQVAKTLQELMDARVTRAQKVGAGKVSDRARVIIQADDRTETVIVSASEEDFQMIRDIVSKLDTPGTQTPPVVIPLQNVEAEELAGILIKYYEQKSKYKLPSTETQLAYPSSVPVITPEPRSNSLIVSAYKQTLDEIQSMVKTFDLASITKKMQIAVIPLRSADASELATAITKVLDPKGDKGGMKQAVILEFIRELPEGQLLIQQALRDQVFIYGDKVSNLLIALAPEDIICIIESLAQTIDQVAPSVEIRVIALENADADQMKDIVKELFSPEKSGEPLGVMGPGMAVGEAAGGTAVSRIEKETFAITSDTRTNSIIITGTPGYLQMIEDIVRKLDAKAIEQRQTEVIALKNAASENIQKAISTLVDERLSILKEAYGSKGLPPERLLENQVTIVADEDSRKVILQASPRYFTNFKKIIEELDEAPSQVMIQSLILQVTLDGSIEYGFEVVGQDLAFTKGQTAPGVGPNHDVVVGTDIGAAGTGLAGFTFSLRGEDFNLLLRALDSDGKLEVLSRPQIMARDNVEAKISIGQRVPYPVSSNIASDTGNITTAISYEDVGVILTVTPHINPDGYVNLEVSPEISSISSSSVQISENLNATVFNNNTVDTTVTIKDGETVVIGGLITTRKDHRENKVPFLGDIPVLGLLFKGLKHTDERNELLVVLTPHIVDTVDKARKISCDERDLMTLLPAGIRESKLMGRLRDVPEVTIVGPAATQPGAEIEAIQDLDSLNVFQDNACNKIRAFKRTCDQ